jgi:tetratricopeptide (TPR) repeat protein
LAQAYLQGQKGHEALVLLDGLLKGTNLTDHFLVSAAQILSQLGAVAQLELTLHKLALLEPDRAEVWFDLAGMQAMQGKTNDALDSLEKSLNLHRKRALKAPGGSDLVAIASQDPRFASLRQNSNFTRMLQMK